MNHRITWIEDGRTFEARHDESLLDAAVRAGVPLPSECSFGACGTCRIRLVSGAVRYDEPPPGLSDDEAANGYALACQARATSDLTVSTNRPLPSPTETMRRRLAVVDVARLCDDVHALTLDLRADEGVVFRPGQYLRVDLGEAGTRSFSMANRPGEGTLVLHIRRITGGHFTESLLPGLRAGDYLDCDLPVGDFGYHEEDYRPIVMIATGTGIAPLWSMLDALLPDLDRPPIALFWGGRTRDDLYLHDELTALQQQHPDFTYTPVLSRADATWHGARGYVQHAVVAAYPDLSEFSVYACGSPVMIGDAKREFAACGMSPRYFYADSFSFQHAAPVANASPVVQGA
ncbi:TPA: 2Fe-2S iron-sulfur cluster binding domain-containing protein [Burkholderia stabilis]|nr:2Fe-2S iron-sulfur cluster binding domain-containing protein [Burkholderia stabilis]HDR9646512.1 2Fe-2S iron-sulfur cluster binding domain-containing protein [Burkholderia stabilis]HDR9657239.1 2Fe-2S iron-sulfur cluster binding domain-containing protein [Burkholderia stabilis]HDR9678182.1 2Fe-2S iron-sulfur cluster binding domain-containing protein [Burkholderia stabilis]